MIQCILGRIGTLVMRIYSYRSNHCKPSTHMLSDVGSNTDMSALRCQAITWANIDVFSVEPWGTHFRDIWNKIPNFPHGKAWELMIIWTPSVKSRATMFIQFRMYKQSAVGRPQLYIFIKMNISLTGMAHPFHNFIHISVHLFWSIANM